MMMSYYKLDWRAGIRKTKTGGGLRLISGTRKDFFMGNSIT